MVDSLVGFSSFPPSRAAITCARSGVHPFRVSSFLAPDPEMSLALRIWNIVSYDNSHTDVMLNYGALMIGLIPLVLVLSCLKPTIDGKYFWVPLSGFLWGFQVRRDTYYDSLAAYSCS